jgi:hypothetical protein
MITYTKFDVIGKAIADESSVQNHAFKDIMALVASSFLDAIFDAYSARITT